MHTAPIRFILPVFFVFLFLFAGLHLLAQSTNTETPATKTFSGSHVFAGSQIPLQFTAGYGYRFSNRVSARAQAGFIIKPYSGFIVEALEAFGMEKSLSTVIKKAFRNGTVLTAGPNYHFGKNYAGIFGQYINLKGGGITPADALSVYFKKDFTDFNVNALPAFEFSMESNLVNAGALFGHEFQLKNPQFTVNAEAGISKIIASTNKFASNRSLVDRTAFARNIYKELDKEMGTAFRKHGYIPTINLYLVYRIPAH